MALIDKIDRGLAVILIAGAIIVGIVAFVLCATDVEFQKHSDSLYATLQWIIRGGWIAIILGVVGVAAYIAGEE